MTDHPPIPSFKPAPGKKAGLSVKGALLAGAIIATWEGMNLTVVHLPFDPPGVITVCGGITNYDWPWLKVGMKFTEEECKKALSEVGEKYASEVVQCVPSLPEMPPHRQAALASFAVNLGSARICKTSIAKDLNAGRIKEACDAMVQYVRANGKFIPSLLRRRTDAMWGERTWCLRED